ncbi:hypothetical protein D3C84_1224230 [compost metagenome]
MALDKERLDAEPRQAEGANESSGPRAGDEDRGLDELSSHRSTPGLELNGQPAR